MKDRHHGLNLNFIDKKSPYLKHLKIEEHSNPVTFGEDSKDMAASKVLFKACI